MIQWKVLGRNCKEGIVIVLKLTNKGNPGPWNQEKGDEEVMKKRKRKNVLVATIWTNEGSQSI